MQVKIFNRTGVNQFLSTDGDEENLHGIVLLGPKDSAIIEVSSDEQFQKLKKSFVGKVDLRKL